MIHHTRIIGLTCFVTAIAGVWPASAAQVNGTPAAAKRVVSLVPSATDIMLALDAADRLVARTDYDDDPRLRDVPSMGGPEQVSLEAIVARRPDLVLLWRVGPGSGLGARLQHVGIRWHALGTESLDELYETIDTLGALLDLRARADSLRRSIADTIAAVGSTSALRPALRVFYVVWTDPPMTVGPGTFIDALISAAGGINIFDDAATKWPQASLEALVERDPQVIVVPVGPSSTLNRHALCVHDAWQLVRAVREGRILEVDAQLFNRPGPRVGNAARRLSTALDSLQRATGSGSAGRCAS